MPSTTDKPRLLIATKDGLRHRLFLSLAHRHLRDYWVATLIQHPPPVTWIHKIKKKLHTLRQTGQSAIQNLLQVHIPEAHIKKRVRPFGFVFQGNFIDEFSLPENMDDQVQMRFPDIQPLNLSDAPNVLFTTNTRKKRVRQWLSKIAPDMIIVLGENIFNSSHMPYEPRLGIINTHYGILPHYTVSNSAELALMHNRFDRIGVTLHYIDSNPNIESVISKKRVSATNCLDLKELWGRINQTGIEMLIASARQSLDQNTRLPVKPVRIKTGHESQTHDLKSTAYVAQWRLKTQTEPWPEIQMRQEICETRYNKSLAIISKRGPVAYRNGIYILLYHGISDPNNTSEWERAYPRINTTCADFRDHIDHLITCGLKPLPLSQAPDKLFFGTSDAPYFVITFDDAYSNLATHAVPILKDAGIAPAVFVNGAFTQGQPYYRVLIALLQYRGYTSRLLKELRNTIPHIPWDSDPDILFDQTKNHYVPFLMEKAVESCYRRHIGDPKTLQCHLSLEQLKTLRTHGWEIGNHTWNHMTLSDLSPEQMVESIENNQKFLHENGLDPIPWLAYPNGLSKHVNPHVKTWLDAHPDTFGIFGGGGVNYLYMRTQWLRIPVGSHNLDQFRTLLDNSIIATNLAFSGKTTLDRHPEYGHLENT